MKRFITLFLALALSLSCIFAFGACAKEPEYDDLSSEFYNASNWIFMTNNGGASQDGGGLPYTLDDGSIKFHNANQAYLLDEDLSNGSVSFMIKTSKDWQMWFRASTADNTKTNCYKLFFKDEVLHIRTSESQNDLAFVSAEDCGYLTNEWNKLELSFSTDENKNCTIKITVNGTKATFTAPEGQQNYLESGDLVYPESEDFTLGNYVIVKVWYGDCYLQLKPLANEGEDEVLKIACIGDSITYGANADNSYTDSYPAQLQKLYNGAANVMNFGNSGKTIRNSADDPYSKTTEYNGAMLFNADIVVLMLGTNDSKTYQVPTTQEMYDAYRVLIEKLYENNPYVVIYMATCPYAYSTSYQISNKNIEDIVIPAQLQIIEDYELECIDMHEFTKNLSNCYADGIHPTSRGYTYLSYMMYCSLEGITPDEDYVNTFKD
ncbi:MAG: hypothetical protein E7370_02835 [Clostridiales bacterium]|nr:hypothetical protein [Clostridiales bacterium]